jgi:hypothetical protein
VFGVFALTLATASCNGGDSVLTPTGVRPSPTASVASLAPTSSPTATEPSPTSTAANGNATIVVPTFAPVTCTPQTVSVVVGGTSIVDCSAADYGGLFSSVVTDPTIASVSMASPSSADFYAIAGLSAGSTTITFSTKSGQSFTVSVSVAPTSPPT